MFRVCNTDNTLLCISIALFISECFISVCWALLLPSLNGCLIVFHLDVTLAGLKEALLPIQPKALAFRGCARWPIGGLATWLPLPSRIKNSAVRILLELYVQRSRTTIIFFSRCHSNIGHLLCDCL